MSRHVAITGIGVIAAGSPGVKAFWERITEGRSAIRGITFFDPAPFRSRIAAECDFDPVLAGLRAQEIRRLDRAAQFAVVCARDALADAGLTDSDERHAVRTGVSLGTAVGCTIKLDWEYAVVSDQGRLWEVDHTYADPHLYDYFVPSSIATEVAHVAGAEGPVAVISSGCTSGLDAVGYAYELIQEGSADVMIAGGTDAPISPITVACFDALKATSNRNDDPEHALRPFDSGRNGFVLGEGCAVLVLEELERAKLRGARVYGTISGFAGRSNAYHMTALRSDGAEMAAAIGAALEQARLPPDAIDYINAHGTGTRQNDRHETAAFKLGLGPHAYQVPVSSIKAVIGHSLGAVGAIEIAACALAMEHGVVPPTANLTDPDPELDLDFVPLTAREKRLRAVLSVASGFGGFQSAMVLKAREGSR